jgi:hypothetical protein
VTSTNLSRRLSSHEEGFQDLDSPARKQVVSGVIFLPAPIQPKILWHRIKQFVEKNPLFKSRITNCSTPHWVNDESYSLDNHCSEFSFNDYAQHQILTYVSQTASTCLDTEHPPWRIALITSKNSQTNCDFNAIAIWAHHSLIDGLRGMELYESLIDENTMDQSVETNPLDCQPSSVVKSPSVISPQCFRLAAAEMLRRPSASDFSVSTKASEDRYAMSFVWERKCFRLARRANRASFQEVLLATFTDAFSRYCGSEESQYGIRAIIPVAKPDTHATSNSTNRHSIGYCTLPTNQPIHNRYDSIRKSLKTIRSEQEYNVFPTLLSFLRYLPNRLRKKLTYQLASRAETLISLIPGKRSWGHIDGVPVTSLFAQPAIPPGHSLTIGITVNREKVFVTAQLDPKCIRDPMKLRVCFEQAYREMNCVQSSQPQALHKQESAIQKLLGIRLKKQKHRYAT